LDLIQRKLFIQRVCQRVAIVGLGGVGKTQLALQLAYWAKTHQPNYSIFWAPALSNATFEQAYREIAKQLPIPHSNQDEDPKELVRRHLSSETAGPWFLVVDNADEMELLFGTSNSGDGLNGHIPISDNGLVLLTTRSREIAVSFAGSDIIDLEGMEYAEAVSFLKKSLAPKPGSLPRNETDSAELLEELTYLPLAITQAAAYLNRNQISIAEYIGLLRNTEQTTISLLSQEFYDNTRYHGSRNAVGTTWLVSFEQIRNSNQDATKLLAFLSCIEPKAIPRSILPKLGREQITRAIGTLCGYAFLSRRGDTDIFDMHSLVHLAAQIWTKRSSLHATATVEAVENLWDVFPAVKWENMNLWREYFPHAVRLLEQGIEVDLEDRFKLLHRCGCWLGLDGRIAEAVQYLEQAYNWEESHLSDDSTERLACQHNLANAYLANGQVGEAITLLKLVVAIKAKVLDETHPSRLASQHELARAYEANGQVGEAITLLKQVVAIEAKVLAETHPDRLASQHELARAYEANGQVGEAITLLEQVVAIQAKVLAETHPDRLASQHELASAYMANGQVGEAITLLEQVVAIQAKVLAENHPDRLASQHALASAYMANGQVGEAITLLKQVVAIRSEVLAETHPDRLASQHELARAYKGNGQVGEAITLLEQVVAIKAKVLAETHPDRLASQHALASAYKGNGQVGEAITLLEQVVAIMAKVLAETHPSRLASQHNLAIYYWGNGQIDEALALMEQVVGIRAEVLAETHPSRVKSEKWLADMLQKMGEAMDED